MTRLFFPTAADSVTCPRCGNSTASSADTCSHCGADLGTHSLAHDAGPSLATSLRMSFTPRRREALNAPYPSLPEASDISRGEQRWDVSKTMMAGGAVIAMLVGGLIYFQHADNDTNRNAPPAGQSASGTIDAKPRAAAIAGVPSAAVSAALPAVASPVALPAPAVSPAVSPATGAAASREPSLGNAGVADNLMATRDAIDRGDLTTARRRFSKIPLAQQDTGNVQRIQAELVSLERSRDDSLRMARACEATGSWNCVRQNARDVLAIDASNVEAQTLVEHAIESSGWLNQPAHPAHAAAPRTVVTTPAHPATAVAAAVPAPRPMPSAAVPVTVPPRLATPTRTLMAAPQPVVASASTPASSMNSALSDTSNPALATIPTTISAPTPTPAPTITRAPLSTDGQPVATGSHTPLSSTAESLDAAPVVARQMPSAIPPILDPTPPEPSRTVVPRADTASALSPAPIREIVVDRPAPVATLAAPAAIATSTVTAQAPVTPHTSSFDAGNADDRERAIKQFGWKNQPATPPTPSQ
jgi:hypothetical protein